MPQPVVYSTTCRERNEDTMTDSESGYKKPPKHTQFKKGRSGNPRGRPKGSKNLGSILERELNSPVQIQEKGRKRSIPRREALVKQLVNDALTGRERARKEVFDLAERAEKSPVHHHESASPEDEEILRRYLERE